MPGGEYGIEKNLKLILLGHLRSSAVLASAFGSAHDPRVLGLSLGSDSFSAWRLFLPLPPSLFVFSFSLPLLSK